MFRRWERKAGRSSSDRTAFMNAVLTAVIVVLLYFGIPALRATVDIFKEQSKSAEALIESWKLLLKAQNAFNQRLLDDLRCEVEKQEKEREKLEQRITELEQALKAKEEQISKLEGQMIELKNADRKKGNLITELETELKKVRAERDELRSRLDALEASRDKVGNDGK